MTIALAACGDLLGVDDETPAPSRPNDDSGADGAIDGGSTESGGEAGTDAGVCTANGTFELDPAYAPVVGLATPRATLSSAGEVVVVGKCGDGGVGLEMATLTASGSVNRVPCFGSTSTEMIASVARTSAGYVVASSRNETTFRARATHVDPSGAPILTDELAPVSGYNTSYAKFALEVSSAIVWGGARSQFNTPDRGFLKVMSKGLLEFTTGEIPVSARVSASQLYVAFIRPLDGGLQHELFVRRYAIGANMSLEEDVTFLSGTHPVLNVVSGTVDGVGAMEVDGDTVIIVAGYASSTRLFRLTGGTWSQDVVPLFSPAHLVRSCDGSLILAGSAYLDGSASTEKGLVRRVNDMTTAEQRMPAQDDITELLRAPTGDLFVVQAAGTVRRVSP